jgi:hypothetical protein
LVANDQRNPPERHPIQSLLGRIAKDGMTANALLCPGDLAHQASPEGLVNGLLELRHVAVALGGCPVVSTLGNHDVASRVSGADPFAIAKHAHPEFPLGSTDNNNSYWANGFAIARISPTLDIVVINSAYHHFSEDLARRGTFQDSQLALLEQALERTPHPPIRVALIHHHPILHSVEGFESEDVLPNGDALLAKLSLYGCQLVIHGHKHHPRLRREMIGGRSLFVFAAGSACVYLNELGSRTRNVCHFLDLSTLPDGTLAGSIVTWEFNYAKGWHDASPRSAAFPHIATFGPTVNDVSDRLATAYERRGEKILYQPALYGLLPELAYLIPDELIALASEVRRQSNLGLEFDSDGRIRLIAPIGDSSLGSDVW